MYNWIVQIPRFARTADSRFFLNESKEKIEGVSKISESERGRIDGLASAFQSNINVMLANLTNQVAWKVKEIDHYLSPEDKKREFSILPYQSIPMSHKIPEKPNLNPVQYKILRFNNK